MPFVTDTAIQPDSIPVNASPYDNPDPSFMETLAASYRRENLIVSPLVNKTRDLSSEEFNRIDPAYNVFDDIGGYEQFADRFERIYNPQAATALKAQIDQEQEDNRTRAASGWTGLFTDVLAGATDPTMLIPAGAFVRSGMAGYKVGRSALSTAVGAGVGTALQEAGLQASQVTRTGTESALNIGGTVLLGGIVGAAGAKFFSNAEWTRFGAKLEEELADDVPNPAEVTDIIVSRMQSAGAAAVDDIKLDDLGVGGPKVAQAVARATAAARINPGIQTMFSPSVKVREAYAKLVDNPILTKMAMEGKTVGPAVENLVKEVQRGQLAKWIKSNRDYFKQAKQAGFEGTLQDFNIRVARAGRRADTDELGNEFVTRAAQQARSEIFDPLLQRAIRNGQLPEDVKVTTAASYVTRLWNRQKLIGEEERFREIARDYFRGRLQEYQPGEIKLQPTPMDPAIKTRLDDAFAENASAIEAIKAARKAAPKVARYPVIDILRKRGGVRAGSPLASELQAMGVTPKSFPGLFKKSGGLSAVDNLVVGESDVLADNLARGLNDYADPNEIMDAVRRELAGDPLMTMAQREALSAYEDANRFANEWLGGRQIPFDAKISEIRKLLKITDVDTSQARTLDDLMFENEQIREAFKAQARTRARIPEFVSAADLEDYIEEIVTSVFNNLTGKGDGDIPEWIVPVKRGPLKERTFNIPDEMIEDFLENDMEMILRRYTRTMGAEVEIAEKFGRADMRDQFDEIRNEYRDLRKKAKTPEDRARLDAAERRDIENLSAFRDLIRGTYRAAEEGSNWSQLTRAALAWNYMRLLGGVTLTSISDAMRLVGVHGVRATMREALPALVSNIKAVQIAKADARDLGAVTETVLQSRLATLAELQDPYRYGSSMDRYISNATNLFSKATGLSWWNDTMKSITSVMTQNRMARNALDWSNAGKQERAYMAMLGIDEDMAGRIAAQLKKHAIQEKNIWGANVSKWDDEAARRAWAAGLNRDTDRTIITPGVADRPLWSRTNWGRLIMQFKSFGLASHQRVLIAGLQERPHRLAEQMVMGTALGMMIGYLKYVERGDLDEAERLTQNPGLWIADGLDRTGILSLPFDISNTAEKVGSPIGIVSAAQMIAGDEDRGGQASRYASRNKLGAVLGPSAGIFQDLTTIAEQLGKADLKKSGANALIRQIPGATLPGVRTAIHVGLKPVLQEAVE